MNGINASWDNNSPANTDLVGQGDDVLRSIRTTLQQTLDDEHNFPATGGANTGYHRLGSARPFQAAASKISSTGTIGRLMVNSTDYSLWGDTGTTPVPLGHQNLLMNANASGVYQRSGTAGAQTTNAIQYGTFTHDGTSGASSIVFAGSGYSGKPAIFCQTTDFSLIGATVARITALSATGFSSRVVFTNTAGITSNPIQVFWMSIGTVAAGVT